MKVNVITGEGVKGVDIHLSVFELQALADLVDSVKKTEEPRKLSYNQEQEIKKRQKEFAMKATNFIKKIIADTPSRGEVENELFSNETADIIEVKE